MAAKRTATSELNHSNWDMEEQPEESGAFRTATKEELQRRVMRTGRRRTQPGSASGSQDKKSVSNTFSGFNKPTPASFDFLSNLTNGAGASAPNGSSTEKDSGSPVALFGSSPVANSTAIVGNSPPRDPTQKTGGGLFGISQVSSSEVKATSMFGNPSLSTSTSSPMLFGMPTNSTTPAWNNSKPVSMFGTPSPSAQLSTGSTALPTMFGASSVTSSPVPTDPKSTGIFGLSKSASPTSSGTSTPAQTQPAGPAGDSKPTMTFGIPSMTSNSNSDSIFGNAATSPTPMSAFKMPPVSTFGNSSFNAGTKHTLGNTNTPMLAKKTKCDDDKKETSPLSSNTEYYSKLKGLNESVSEWIKEHVNDNPLCILTPIFRDYEIYLKELEEEHGPLTGKTTPNTDNLDNKENTIEEKKVSSVAAFSNIASTSLFTTNAPTGTAASVLSLAKPITGLFTTTSPAGTPFSFGTGNTFSLNSNILKPAEQNEEQKDAEENDEPPKVDFTPVTEENTVFEKRCKIFFKKDGNFVDNGVGTLYIKTIDNSDKHQLIVRANTSLATVLLNFILSESIPSQRMGKNNVMIVCIPTPDSKPPPVPVLIRVKTSEEADGLLETFKKYKK